MKRALLVLAACMAAAGCSDSTVIVRASLQEGGAPITDMPVYLLPYDRQALLDSLAEASDEKEPTIPSALVQQLESLSAPAGAPGDSAARVARAARTLVRAQIDSIRAARTRWRAEVFADFDSIAAARVVDAGGGAATDTTDARGIARLRADEGRLWIYATYVLPETTLEWNEIVTVRGDSVVVPLTRKNAKERPFF